MSLISDTDFLIHTSRLSYLRNVEDPYGSRIISLNPFHASNPYILAASLADSDKWPELTVPTSPVPTEPTGGGLKHTQTIMGPSRTGMFGMRVGGRRSSNAVKPGRSSIRASRQLQAQDTNSNEANGKVVVQAPTPHFPPAAIPGTSQQHHARHSQSSSQPKPDSWIKVSDTTNGTDAENTKEPVSTSAPSGSIARKPEEQLGASPPPLARPQPGLASTPPTQPQPPPEVQFIPKFKGAAEMEARRRIRMLNRPRPLNLAQGSRPPSTYLHKDSPIKAKYLNAEDSGSEEGQESEMGEVDDEEDEDEEFDEDEDELGAEIDGEDEFDPDFAATRTPGLASSSGSMLSMGLANSASVSSSVLSLRTQSHAQPPASLSVRARTQSRLSPVREGKERELGEARRSRAVEDGTGFDIVTAGPGYAGGSKNEVGRNTTGETVPVPNPQPPTPSRMSISADEDEDPTLFSRKPVSASPQKSALTALLSSSASSTSNNPFTQLYAAIASRSLPDALTLTIFFPNSNDPEKPMELKVRKDASVEEVIGFALWSYWEKGWEPELKVGGGEGGEEGKDGEPEAATAAGWILRIAEDDGEVDEDFPPPDRAAKISKFNFDAYAILEANTAQVQQNKTLEAKIQRRPSRIMAAKKKPDQLPVPTLGPGGLIPPALGVGTSLGLNSTSGPSSGVLSSSLGPSSSYGPQIFLRIRIAETVDAVHFSTTVQASSGMYMQEVLDLVCRKRKLMNPKDYALLLGDLSILIPLDRTVASLQGKTDLALVKMSMLPQLGIDVVKQTGRTTDPNASIFEQRKRMSEMPEAQFSAMADYTTAYKKYTIYRKMPMLVGRQERTLAIDGAYIHVMPSSNKAKAVFESGKTASYHMRSVMTCQQSAKSSSTFKLIVYRDGGVKRYDFEADSPRLAHEIVQTIKTGMKMDRSSTMRQSRRSRQVG